MLSGKDPKLSVRDAIDSIKRGRIRFARTLLHVHAGLCKLAALELGVPCEELKTEHFSTPLKFLGGKSLSRLYEYYVPTPPPEAKNNKRIPPFLREGAARKLGFNEVVRRLRNGGKAFWVQVPESVVLKLVWQLARQVRCDYQSGPGGTWHKLGPWTTAVSDGTIEISATHAEANFSGFEVWSMGSQTRVPNPPARLRVATPP